MNNNGFLSMLLKNPSLDNIYLSATNCSFYNVSQNLTLDSIPFFYIRKPFVSVSLLNCSFFSNLFSKLPLKDYNVKINIKKMIYFTLKTQKEISQFKN